MIVRRYMRIPLVVEAVQVTLTNYEQVAEWCRGAIGLGKSQQPVVCIYSEKMHRQAQIGDYVIKGTDGDFYVREPTTFEATYVAPRSKE